jgi:hypothetical protein
MRFAAPALAVLLSTVAGAAGAAAAQPNVSTSRVELTMPTGSDHHDMTDDGIVDWDRRSETRLPDPNDESFVGWRSDERIVGTTAYVGWMRAGKTCWLEELNYDSSNPLELMLVAGDRPDTIRDVLRGSARTIEPLGEAAIRGVSTHGYRFRLDSANLAGEWARFYRNETPESMVVDAWLDDEGVARRLEFDLYPGDFNPIRIEFFDFGVPVHVDVPAHLLGNVGGCALP